MATAELTAATTMMTTARRGRAALVTRIDGGNDEDVGGDGADGAVGAEHGRCRYFQGAGIIQA